jgi:ParB-like chromosome segregation protein Spo0J
LWQRLRLLTFPSDLQELVSRDTITPSHAELLAKLADHPSELEDAIAKVAQGKLTTRETANLVAPLVEMTFAGPGLLDERRTLNA